MLVVSSHAVIFCYFIHHASSQYSVVTRGKLHIGLPVRSTDCPLPRPQPYEERNTPSPNPNLLGAYVTSTPRLWRGLDTFGVSVSAFSAPRCRPSTAFLIRPLLLSVRGLRIKLQNCLGDKPIRVLSSFHDVRL